MIADRTFAQRRAESEADIVYICVNGILAWPGSADGWTDRAVTWLNLHTAGKAEKFEYAAGPLLRRVRQQSRAQAIARMVDFYRTANYEVVLIGHSNGCDLIARVLGLTRHEIRSVHLFAAAAEWQDFALPLACGQLGRMHAYVGGFDGALKVAALSRTLFGCFGLGYGSLGLGLPADAQRYARQVTETIDPMHGHSDWFRRGDYFEATMQRLIENEFSDSAFL